MVSFLAIGAGVTFDFPLSPRSSFVSDDLLGLAQEWLTAALVDLRRRCKDIGRLRLVPTLRWPRTVLRAQPARYST